MTSHARSSNSPTRSEGWRNTRWRLLSGAAIAIVLGASATILNSPATWAAATQPSAANTGVPTGTALKAVYGDLKIIKSGTYSNLDVHGFVIVQADNVIITKSRIRGGTSTKPIGLINNIFGNKNLVLTYSTIAPDRPSVSVDGVKGGNYTLDHVNIYGTVDGAKVFGNNVMIKNSYIHDLKHFAHDPGQSGGPSHNDGIQVLGGANVTITANTIRAATTYNSALQVTQSYGSTHGLKFTSNWVGGGACTLNVTAKPLALMKSITLSSNHFYSDSKYRCAIIIDRTVSYTATSNSYIASTGVPRIVTR